MLRTNQLIFNYLILGYLELQQTLDRKYLVENYFPSCYVTHSGVQKDHEQLQQGTERKGIQQLVSNLQNYYQTETEILSPRRQRHQHTMNRALVPEQVYGLAQLFLEAGT